MAGDRTARGRASRDGSCMRPRGLEAFRAFRGTRTGHRDVLHGREMASDQIAHAGRQVVYHSSEGGRRPLGCTEGRGSCEGPYGLTGVISRRAVRPQGACSLHVTAGQI